MEHVKEIRARIKVLKQVAVRTAKAHALLREIDDIIKPLSKVEENAKKLGSFSKIACKKLSYFNGWSSGKAIYYQDVIDKKKEGTG